MQLKLAKIDRIPRPLKSGMLMLIHRSLGKLGTPRLSKKGISLLMLLKLAKNSPTPRPLRSELQWVLTRNRIVNPGAMWRLSRRTSEVRDKDSDLNISDPREYTSDSNALSEMSPTEYYSCRWGMARPVIIDGNFLVLPTRWVFCFYFDIKQYL